MKMHGRLIYLVVLIEWRASAYRCEFQFMLLLLLLMMLLFLLLLSFPTVHSELVPSM